MSSRGLIPPHGPLVIAHRGASHEAPEHTMAAFALALQQGADGLEADLRLTTDGHLVCVHDRTLTRTGGDAGRGVVIANTTLAELQRIDVGAWHRTGSARGERIPTLTDLLDLARSCGRPLQVALETKHPTRHGGRTERVLAAVLRDAGLTRADPQGVTVVVMSFNAAALMRMARLLPDVPRVLLCDQRPLAAVLVRGRFTDIEGWSVRAVRADPMVVARARGRGHGVAVWTVDEPADVAHCVSVGVDALITNRPAQVLTALGRQVA